MYQYTATISSAILIVIAIWLSATVSKQGMKQLQNEYQMFFPSWVFIVAWSILYALIFIGTLFIEKNASFQQPQESTTKTWFQILLITNMVLNALWSVVFFKFRAFELSLLMIVGMIATIIPATIIAKEQCGSFVLWFYVPYLLWLTVAATLNMDVIVQKNNSKRIKTATSQ
jgi:tryptophan-rich sensory protein